MKWLLTICLGDTEPARKGRDLALVALPWFLADLVAKCLALVILKDREVSLFWGELKFLLHVNESLFSHGRTPSHLGTTDATAFWVAMSVGLSAVACVPFARAQSSVPRKLLLMLAVFLGGGTAGSYLGSWLEWEPQRWVLHAMRAFAALAVLLLGLRLTRSRYLGLALGLAVAGTLGNSINVVYYPRGIIDFMYVRAFSPYLGVFNLADAALEVSKGLILLSPLFLVLFRRLARGNPKWERRLEYVDPVEPAPLPPQPGNG